MKIKTKDYLLSFDFDGVLWDTVDECFYIGYKVFRNMIGEISRDNHALRAQFRRGRYLAKNAKDFYVLLYLLKEDPRIDFDLVTFDKFLSFREAHKEAAHKFVEGFYRERSRLTADEKDYWLMFQEPYPGILEQIPGLKREFFDVAICSAKDMPSIKMLIDLYDQKYPIYSREHSSKKQDLFFRLSKDKNIPLEHIIFIDDVMENLVEVRKTGVNVMMAAWGYNNLCERKKAVEKNIPLLYMEDLRSQIAGYCEKLSQKI